MASASDERNLVTNLKVLKDLPQRRKGSKISYDNSSGLFSIQEPGKLTSLARTFSRDSVTSKQYFEDPLVLLFGSSGISVAGECRRAYRFRDGEVHG